MKKQSENYFSYALFNKNKTKEIKYIQSVNETFSNILNENVYFP